MLGAPRPVDYKSNSGPLKTVSPATGGAVRRQGTSAAVEDSPTTRNEDLATAESFLHLLARATRQFHTYPSTSTLCTEAIAACHRAFTALESRDRLVVRITPTELIVDEIGVGAGTIIEQELVQRLHRAHVATVDFDRAASPRDLARFCTDVVHADELAKTTMTFAELLAEHGVETILPQMAHRPEVLEVGAPTASQSQLVEREHERQPGFAPGAPVTYLYPPERGWVRLDPAAKIDAVSLIDLAVLVNDPADLASMLLRLTGDEAPGGSSRAAALEQKLSDVATLFASLDPRLARVMFGKLSRAVLELEPERRKALLKRTVLPGLLDGRAEGAVLRDFPDINLAESLCLLLELETAASEVLTAALDKLELPEDRRQKVVPLIDAQLRGDAASDSSEGGRDKTAGLDQYARQLIRIKASDSTSFSEYAAFDLSIDARVSDAIAAVGTAIADTDLTLVQLRCLWNLTRLEPNPSVVEAFLRRGLALLVELERSSRWTDLTLAVAEYRQILQDLQHTRPDVADAIHKALAAFCSPDRVLGLAELSARDDEGRRIVNGLAEAFGTALVPSLVVLLDDRAVHAKIRPLVPLMCEYSHLFAPALVSWLGQCDVSATRTIIRVLGFAGKGYEAQVAAAVEHRDEQTRREALRALARIGTPQAAALVTQQVRAGNPASRAAAEEALWHFVPQQTAQRVRELLGSRDFVLQNPAIAARLLDRAAQAGTDGLEPVLAELSGLRFRFWNPALVRVANKARELRER
jgi:hypothetical protein